MKAWNPSQDVKNWLSHSYSYDAISGHLMKMGQSVRIMKNGAIDLLNHELGLKRSIQASHIMWYLTFGEFPSKRVYHTNQVKTDFRLSNLQLGFINQLTAPANKAKRTTRFGCQVTRKIGGIRRDAVKRGLTFELSEEQAEDLLVANCHYCGDVSQNVGPNRCSSYKGMNGIDRVDSASGYTSTNVVTCCFTCNRAKGSLSVEAFDAWTSRRFAYMNRASK